MKCRDSALYYEEQVSEMMELKDPTLADLDALRIQSGIRERKSAPKNMNVHQFIIYFAHGYLMNECRDGITMYQLPQRDIIPLCQPVPHENNRGIKKGGFSFTTNQRFIEVLAKCASPRERRPKGYPPREAWIRSKIKDLLIEANTAEHRLKTPFSCAHSIEVWRENELVGGAILLQIGAAIISMSLFSHYDCAGKAIGVFMQKIMINGGFKMHDSGIRSNFSDYFHARLIDNKIATDMRLDLIFVPLDFPNISDKIPFDQIAAIKKTESGWSLPCEESHAEVEEPDGDQARCKKALILHQKMGLGV